VKILIIKFPIHLEFTVFLDDLETASGSKKIKMNRRIRVIKL